MRDDILGMSFGLSGYPVSSFEVSTCTRVFSHKSLHHPCAYAQQRRRNRFPHVWNMNRNVKTEWKGVVRNSKLYSSKGFAMTMRIGLGSRARFRFSRMFLIPMTASMRRSSRPPLLQRAFLQMALWQCATHVFTSSWQTHGVRCNRVLPLRSSFREALYPKPVRGDSCPEVQFLLGGSPFWGGTWVSATFTASCGCAKSCSTLSCGWLPVGRPQPFRLGGALWELGDD